MEVGRVCNFGAQSLVNAEVEEQVLRINVQHSARFATWLLLVMLRFFRASVQISSQTHKVHWLLADVFRDSEQVYIMCVASDGVEPNNRSYSFAV